MLPFFVYSSIGLIYLALLVAILLEESSAAKRSFALFVFGIFLWVVTLYVYFFVDVGEALTFWGRLNYGAGILIAFGLFSFFYYFPKKDIKLPKLLEKVIFAFPVTFFCIVLFTPFINAQESMTLEGPRMTKGIWYEMYTVISMSYLLMGFFIGIIKIFSLTGLNKMKFMYSFWGAIPTCFLGFLQVAIFNLLEINISQEYPAIVILPMAFIFFYSIHHHRFFQFSYLSLKLLRLSIISTLSILCSASFFTLFHWIKPESDLIFLLTSGSIFGIILFHWLLKMFPEITTQSFREFQKSILNVRSDVYGCETYQKLKHLLEQNFIIKNNIKFVEVFSVLPKRAQINLPVYVEDLFTQSLQKAPKDILVKEEIPFLKLPPKNKSYLKKVFKKQEMSLCLPLFSGEKIIGFLALGQKEKNTPFSKEEIDELLTIQAPLQVCFMNILIEKNLQKENDLMKTIIKEKTQKINRQLKKIESLSQQQADFIAISAHELRTPLTIAMLKLEMLSADKNVAPKLKEVNAAIKKLHQLIQKFFDVQKYDLNKVVVSSIEVNASEFFQDIHDQFAPLIKAQKINFLFENKLPKRAKISIDPFQIQQVFQNFFSNALRFTPENGTIRPRLKNKTKHLGCCVSDSGPGIPQKEKDHIFEKFKSDPKLQGKGIGLGLYICRKIIELHKGKIWVEDSDLGGAKFCIQLPK